MQIVGTSWSRTKAGVSESPKPRRFLAGAWHMFNKRLNTAADEDQEHRRENQGNIMQKEGKGVN